MRDYKAKTSFESDQCNGVKWVYSKRIKEAGALHGFTQRYGGVSASPFESLNLGWNRDEPKENIKENYLRLCSAAGLDYQSLALVSYAHCDLIQRAHAADCGKGFGNGAFPSCDALITDDPSITLITLHADCMPIFLFEPEKRCSAMIHAGWKGASLRIAQKSVNKMVDELGADPKKMLAFIGPSISPDHFEVETPVMEIFKNNFSSDCIKKGDCQGKFYVDLWLIMLEQLKDSGLDFHNIELSGICTYDSLDYFSYRRDKRTTGAMAGFIKINI